MKVKVPENPGPCKQKPVSHSPDYISPFRASISADDWVHTLSSNDGTRFSESKSSIKSIYL